MPAGAKYGGRQPGSVNKTTREFRETIQEMLNQNVENIPKWLRRVAEGDSDVKADPGKALDLIAKLAEFVAPKLARTEVTGTYGGPVMIQASKTDEQL